MSRAAHKAATCARSELERDALAHPSFAHCSEADVLDHISSGLADANRRLPLEAEDAAYRAHVFSHIAKLLGVQCCLCGWVFDINQNGRLRTSLPFLKWLCGDFDATQYANLHIYPLCPNCNSKVVCFSAAQHGTGWGLYCQPLLDDELEFVTVLYEITKERGFRRRVETHAASFLGARFDPRQHGAKR